MLQENNLINKVIWPILAIISLSAIVLINQYSPYIPDYDGLDYFRVAKIMNGWLTSPSDYRVWTPIINDFVSFWPITNALSVFITAFFLRTIDTNLLPALINSLYLYLFAAYVAKIRSVSYAYITVLLLCAHTLFFRLFNTLTSEFSVGLWIYAFLLTLISNDERRCVYLVALTMLGLLQRTIDIVFILMATFAYVVIHYAFWKNKQHIFITLRYIGLTLVLTIPLFFRHYMVTFKYVYLTSSDVTAASWKALAGVSDRSDVILQYAKFLFLYNPTVIPVVILITAFSFFYSKRITRRSAALVTGMSLFVCIPLVMASSLNIMVVFWVYTALIFMICELGIVISNDSNLIIKKLIFPNGAVIKNIIFVCALLNCTFFLHRSWSYELPYLRLQKDISKIAFDISTVLDSESGTPTIAANFFGVGALDNLGLAWRRRDNFFYGGISDVYSKNKNPAEYLELKQATNFFITAHENYFFAPHFGINDHIKETHRLFTERSSELGFWKVKEISRDGKIFDIWYRPRAQAYLQYASFGDNWISRNLPIEIGTKSLCSGEKISGKLNFSVNFPNPNLPSYTPPFLITIQGKNAKSILASEVINNYGNADVVFDLKNIICGEYELSIDKTFSTKADPRELSAQFIKIDSTFKFDTNEIKEE